MSHERHAAWGVKKRVFPNGQAWGCVNSGLKRADRLCPMMAGKNYVRFVLSKNRLLQNKRGPKNNEGSWEILMDILGVVSAADVTFKR